MKEEQPLRFERIEDIITYGAAAIYVFESETLMICTENHEIKSVTTVAGKVVSSDSDLLKVNTSLHEKMGVTLMNVKTANKTWVFGIVEGAIYFITPKGNLITLDELECIGSTVNRLIARY